MVFMKNCKVATTRNVMFKLDIPDYYSFVCSAIRTGVLTVFICSHSDRGTDISASFYSRRKDCDVVVCEFIKIF